MMVPISAERKSPILLHLSSFTNRKPISFYSKKNLIFVDFDLRWRKIYTFYARWGSISTVDWPLSKDEIKVNSPVGISCNENKREVSAIQNIANKQIDRTLAFDKVFGPTSQQKDLFDHTIVPIVNEVLEGYNCTVFAYGQTGTGETYTMEGGRKTKNGDFPEDAGVIPRSVRQVFDILESQNAEYSMKVTLLELYNEEITDLLAAEELKFSDDKSKKPIALMEDGREEFLFDMFSDTTTIMMC